MTPSGASRIGAALLFAGGLDKELGEAQAYLARITLVAVRGGLSIQRLFAVAARAGTRARAKINDSALGVAEPRVYSMSGDIGSVESMTARAQDSPVANRGWVPEKAAGVASLVERTVLERGGSEASRRSINDSSRLSVTTVTGSANAPIQHDRVRTALATAQDSAIPRQLSTAAMTGIVAASTYRTSVADRNDSRLSQAEAMAASTRIGPDRRHSEAGTGKPSDQYDAGVAGELPGFSVSGWYPDPGLRGGYANAWKMNVPASYIARLAVPPSRPTTPRRGGRMINGDAHKVFGDSIGETDDGDQGARDTGPLTQSPRSTAESRTSDGQHAIEGDVFLDGALVGRWMSHQLTREIERAPAGRTGFDVRRGRLLPGPTVGGL